MAGLLGFTLADLSGAVDSRKRQYANLVRGLLSDPGATLAQLAAVDAEAARGNRYTQMSAGSVMPEVAQQGQEAMLNAAMNVGGLLGITKSGPIADWKWRPPQDVRNEVGLSEVPDYIQNVYGQFMKEQAGKAANHELGARDLIKAYGITRSSVNRGARNMNDDLAKGETRPEGYFAEWLLSPHGKAYLDDAENGVVNEAAIKDIRTRFAPFGMADTLAKDLKYAAESLSKVNGSTNEAIAGDKSAWRAFAQDLNGIGPSKSGFIASLLGRGDIPTFDARQIKLHTGGSGKDASKYIKRGDGAGGDAAVDRLAKRQKDMGLSLSPELEPFYQHLTHHAVWDKTAGTTTTHDDLVRAMRMAGLLGATGLPLSLLSGQFAEDTQP